MGIGGMIGDEFDEKEIFLAEAESYLSRGLYRKAQESAMAWLSRFPGDAEARIIACHAWTRLGKLDKVKQMLKEVDEAILAMSRIYARMGDICGQAGLNREAIVFYQRFRAINPGAPDIEEVEEKLGCLLKVPERSMPGEDETPEEGYQSRGLKTVTMAELYIKQGHLDLALEVLAEILEQDGSNLRAAARMKELQAIMAPRVEAPLAARANNEGVIRELNCWLHNLDRMQGNAV